MPEGRSRRRTPVVAVLICAGLLSASLIAPALGAPQAVSAASLAAQVKKALKLATTADRNARKALNEPGPIGPTGPVGPTGPRGLTGPAGEKGQMGPRGETGLTGSPGQDGQPGQTGQTGARGPASFVNVLQGGDFTPATGNGGCTVALEWRECAKVTVNVPAGKTYLLAIDSDGSYFAFNKTTQVRVCTSVRASTTAFDPVPAALAGCVNQPTGITLSNDMRGVGTNGVREVSGGAAGASYIVSTAVRPEAALDFYNGYRYEVVHTMVTVSEKN